MGKISTTLTDKDASRAKRPVSRTLRVAAADLIMAHADFEVALEDAIWAYVNVEPRFGRLLTGSDVRRKCGILKELAADAHDAKWLDENLTPIWKPMELATAVRNLIAHGQSYMFDLTSILVITMRKGDTKRDLIGAQVITLEELRSYHRVCLRSAGHLFDLARQRRAGALPSG